MSSRTFPSVRLVVPSNGDRPEYLEQCLASVRRQREPVEAVVVGPARAADALREVAKRHGCGFLVEDERGLSNAVNQGWRGATTQYLTWLGDDDLLTEGSLSATREALDRVPGAAMAYGRLTIIDADDRTVYTLRPGTFASWFFRYGQNFVGQPGSLYRRSAVQRVGMLDPALRYAMDFDLHLRLRQGGGMVYLPQVLGCFRVHPSSLTVTNPCPDDEGRRVMRRYLGRTALRLEPYWWPLAQGLSKAWGATMKSGLIRTTARNRAVLRTRTRPTQGC
ncbi:glycosyltransferase [Streptomyces sp. NPDC059349]|uniref:glycosyltransferase n=1 Tax=Streptomyces sp. NPDC059349 TaxID=3346808 RepID=UPI0036BAC9EB